MPTKTFTINGALIDSRTKNGIANLTVEAWDKDVKRNDLLGTATSDAEGKFTIYFREEMFKDHPLDADPDVFFKIFQGENLLCSSEEHYLKNIKSLDRLFLIFLNQGQLAVDSVGFHQAQSVSGNIGVDGVDHPAAGMLVRAYNSTLKGGEVLGEAMTDFEGNYSILYYPTTDCVHLGVKVLKNAKSRVVLAESELVHNAGESVKIDLKIAGDKFTGLDLYTMIHSRLTWALEGLSPDQLTDKQLKILACDTGIDAEHLEHYRRAHQLKKTDRLMPEIFFALLRVTSARTREELFSFTDSEFLHHINIAFDSFIISKKAISSELGAQLKIYRQLALMSILQQPNFESGSTMQELWGITKLPSTIVGRLSELMLEHKDRNEDFWIAVRKDSKLKPYAEKIQLGHELFNLTIGNLKLVQKIYSLRFISSLNDLAGWTEKKWMEQIQHPSVKGEVPAEISGKNREERQRIYARSMKRMVDYLYPGKNHNVSLTSDTSLSTKLRADYKKFYENNAEYDLSRTNIEDFEKANPRALRGVKDKERLRKDLSRNSRLAKVSPAIDQYEHMSRLRKLGMGRAGDITGMGNAGFTEAYVGAGGSFNDANAIFASAQHIQALLEVMTMKYSYDMMALPYVMSVGIQNDPTWKTFFGEEDYCTCNHCKSVYSPAAYLADTLHFLENQEVYEELDSRRPDIKHILLNCENAHTPMPYIDLVNEILEHRISGEGVLAKPEFEHQTTLERDELKALPENLRSAAYKVLRASHNSWDAPFDLYNELGKSYLEHLGVAHHKLVEIFAQNSDSESGKKDWIKATLSLNETDWQLIHLDKYEDWAKNNDSVRTILNNSNLSFEELKTLVFARYVDPERKLFIDQSEEPCNLDKIVITNIGVAHRKRMVQLIRLSKKLKTDVRTVDNILSGLKASAINVEILYQIAHLFVWNKKYNLAYDSLTTWLGKMPTGYEAGDKQLYESLFFKETESVDATVRKYFELDGDRTELNITNISLVGGGQKTREVRGYVIGALGISAEELDAIAPFLPVSLSNLTTLSLIYGAKTRAKALGVSIVDLMKVRKLIPFAVLNDLQKTKLEIELLSAIRESNVTLENAVFAFSGNGNQRLSEDEKVSRLEQIKEGLWKMEGTVNGEDQPLTPESFIHEKLSILFGINRENIVRLLSDQNGAAYLSSGSSGSYMEMLTSENFVGSEETISLSDFAKLDELCDLLNRISVAFEGLHFDDKHYAMLLSEEGKAWLDLNNLKESYKPGQAYLDILRADRMIQYTPNTSENLIDFVVNPPSAITNAGTNIDALFSYEGGKELLSALGMNAGALKEKSALYIIWKGITLEKHLGIKLSDYLPASNGVFSWIDVELNQVHVGQIIQVAKAKYGEEKWLQVTSQLRDDIREKQRDALVAFLQNENGFKSTNELYGNLLIDVEMSACTMTSRIKLAVSSTQLFVQRYLMNLEQNISMEGLSEERQLEWKEWEWRKNYRVWEANRKVFLYPENWLEPEWRDDKTPFFHELEKDLQQGELSSANAEKAYSSYLSKLESVSDLEVLAMCSSESNSDYLYHYSAYIFGRSKGTPNQLYFRKYTDTPESFSPWQKVEIDFQGSYLHPIVYNERLFVFWPVIDGKSLDGEKLDHGYSDPIPYKEVAIAWSEFVDGSWTPKQVSENVVSNLAYDGVVTSEFTSNDRALMFETQFSEEGNLEIRVLIPVADPDNNWKKVGRSIGVFSLYDRKYTNENSFVLNDWNWPLQSPYEFSYIQHVDDNNPASTLWYRYELELPGYVKFENFRVLDHLQVDDFIAHYRGGGIKEIIHLQHKKLSAEASGELLYGEYQLDTAYTNESAEYYPYLRPVPEFSTQFALHQANANYNWELFYHIPIHIANKLRLDQKFDEAQQWFHYVFNPMSSEDLASPQKFWLFKPFRDLVCTEGDVPCNIQELLELLNQEGSMEGYQEIENSVHQWERNPFSPHTVARARIIAYMKWTVMCYIDNLIEWADQLFRRDSIESLNEATQLYMLAWNILGRKPDKLNEIKSEDLSYDELKELGLDKFSNAMVKLENRLIRINKVNTRRKKAITDPLGWVEAPTISPELPAIEYVGQEVIDSKTLYFCVPRNEKLMGYWSLVNDRLFKLRNCLNIEGVYRQLPLYEPPIDPALLIKAKAAGLSMADILSPNSVTASPYRFIVLLHKAIDYANDVRNFGGALLSALEKRDAETIGELRARHEAQIIQESMFIRKEQIKEHERTKQGLQFTRNAMESRKKYFENKDFMNSQEVMESLALSGAKSLDLTSQSHALLANAAALIPSFHVGYSGWGGHSTAEIGGGMASNALKLISEAYSIGAYAERMSANEIGKRANYIRRQEDWEFQASQADMELDRIDEQILAAEIRIAVAEKELENHATQVKNSSEQLELLQTKFTNAELYDWIVGQLKTQYFQSYQMAFDMAKKAEAALADEFDIKGTMPFIQFGYWDNLKQGLMSGEKLHHDLKRMEMSYMEKNARKQEVSQTFSLAMIDPESLIELRATGSCNIEIPEVYFDLAHPKLDNRKVKSVSITIPAVTGPYTGVHATLSNGSERISTSSGQNDTGLFQFSFNDERYLPFENLDPTSIWQLSMNKEVRMFDYNTISDILLHINYTADYEDGKNVNLISEVKELPISEGKPLMRFFSLKNEFANEWFQAKKTGASLSIHITKEMLPFTFREMTIHPLEGGVKFVQLPLQKDFDVSNMASAMPKAADGGWSITIDASLEEDILMVFSYKIL